MSEQKNTVWNSRLACTLISVIALFVLHFATDRRSSIWPNRPSSDGQKPEEPLQSPIDPTYPETEESPDHDQQTVVPVVTASPLSVDFKKVWADQNVLQEERAGIRVHLRFIIKNSDRLPCTVKIVFRYQNGLQLRDFNGQFVDETGNVATIAEFSPDYPNTEFEDYALFTPYDELHLGWGEHFLELQANIVGPDSDQVIATSDPFPFSVTYEKAEEPELEMIDPQERRALQTGAVSPPRN